MSIERVVILGKGESCMDGSVSDKLHVKTEVMQLFKSCALVWLSL